MGLPGLLLVLSQNQEPVAKDLAASGLARNLGWGNKVTPDDIARALAELLDSFEERERMSRLGPTLVDGKGAARVVAHLERALLSLRAAGDADCRRIWEWANAPSVRAVSFSQDPIPWERHQEWFRAKLADPACSFWVAVREDGTPVGEVRFDPEGADQVVSIIVAPEARGRGYGSAILRLGTRKLFDATRADRIHAYIKPGNDASVGLFRRAGFAEQGDVTVRGARALHFVLVRA
jgi:RimJ/RimL family protein N-acetyltransferase